MMEGHFNVPMDAVPEGLKGGDPTTVIGRAVDGGAAGELITVRLGFEQAQTPHPLTGEDLYRWRVMTDDGLKITWKPSADAAREAAEARGYVVISVEESAPLDAGDTYRWDG